MATKDERKPAPHKPKHGGLGGGSSVQKFRDRSECGHRSHENDTNVAGWWLGEEESRRGQEGWGLADGLDDLFLRGKAPPKTGAGHNRHVLLAISVGQESPCSWEPLP